MDLTAAVLLYFVLFGAIGMLIGGRKGRPIAGLLWAMVLGPIGWLLMALLPAASANTVKAGSCPHCGGVVAIDQAKCNHCGNALTWIKGKAYRPSRPVAA